MIELSLNEAESLAAKVARGAGYSWGLADEIGRAARRLASRGQPWADALVALAASAAEFDPPSPQRVAKWRLGEDEARAGRPLCPIRTAAWLEDDGAWRGAAPLRIAGVGLPIWLEGALANVEIERVPSAPLAPVADVTISPGGASPSTSRRAPISERALAALDPIAGRVYVPESERSRARGAGGGSVDED